MEKEKEYLLSLAKTISEATEKDYNTFLNGMEECENTRNFGRYIREKSDYFNIEDINLDEFLDKAEIMMVEQLMGFCNTIERLAKSLEKKGNEDEK